MNELYKQYSQEELELILDFIEKSVGIVQEETERSSIVVSLQALFSNPVFIIINY